MKGAGGKNSWALFLLLLTGIVLGGCIYWHAGRRGAGT